MRTAPVKACPGCNSNVHARSSSCKTCGHKFYVTKKDLQRIDNWRDLKPGDKIKSISKNGPYWVDPSTREKLYMGSYGEFVVEQVGANYINCYEIGKVRKINGRMVNCSEIHTLYMGKFEKSDLCNNLYRDSHKLIRLVSSKKRKVKSYD